MIDIRELYFSYNKHSGEENTVLNGINLRLAAGEFAALMGANGSGKSTLALCIKGIVKPTGGNVFIDGYDINDEKTSQEAADSVGIVFQNPDNQFISTSVEREIAFGLENQGVSYSEMERKICEQMDRFLIEEYRRYSPERLSGGEKQKVLLASIMASDPKYLILDEATSHLDPHERKRITRLLRDEFNFKKGRGFSILLITQCPFEALDANRLIIIERGQVAFDDKPDEVFKNADTLKDMGVRVPLEYELLS